MIRGYLGNGATEKANYFSRAGKGVESFFYGFLRAIFFLMISIAECNSSLPKR